MLSEFNPCPKCKKKENRERKQEIFFEEKDGGETQAFIMYCKIDNFYWIEKYQTKPPAIHG